MFCSLLYILLLILKRLVNRIFQNSCFCHRFSKVFKYLPQRLLNVCLMLIVSSSNSVAAVVLQYGSFMFSFSFPFVIYSSFLYPLPFINSFLHRLSHSGLLTLEPLLVIDEWLRSSTQRPVPTLSSALKATGVGEGSPSKCSADRDLASGLFF